MSSLGNYATAGVLECETLFAKNIKGNIELIDVCANTLSLKDKWEFSLDAQNNFFLTNKMINVVGISGNSATGKMYINDDNQQGSTTLDQLTDVCGTTVQGAIMYHDANISKYRFTSDLQYDFFNWYIRKPLIYINRDIEIFNFVLDVSKNINIGGEKRLNLTTFNNISIGNGAGRTSQGIGSSVTGGSIAIGLGAGDSSQNHGAIAIGRESGLISQGERGIAIGEQSGRETQSNYTVAIGFEAGKTSQQTGAVGIGNHAGQINQGVNSFALGTGAGKTDLSENAIALGNLSAHVNSGKNSVYIGSEAGSNGNNHPNVLVLNATGTSLIPDISNSTFIKPLRENTGLSYVKYNVTNGEMTYNTENLQPQLDAVQNETTPSGGGKLELVTGSNNLNKLKYTPPVVSVTPTSIYLSGTLPVDSPKVSNGYYVIGGSGTGGLTFDIDSGNITKNSGEFTVPEACKLQISYGVTARDNTAPALVYELLIDIEKALASSPTTFVKKKTQLVYLQSMGGTIQFSCNCSGMIDFAQGDIFRGRAYISSAGGTGTPDAIFKETGTYMSAFRIN